VIREQDENVPVTPCTRIVAYLRAEPVAALYERAREARRRLSELEDEMWISGVDGLSSGVARPARCAGLGGGSSDLRREGAAAGEGAVARSLGLLF